MNSAAEKICGYGESSVILKCSAIFSRRKAYQPGFPYLVGVTGAMASGKSAVCRTLAAMLSCALIDLDAICRKLLEPGNLGWQMLTRDKNIPLCSDERGIDRPRLRAMLFADDTLRRQLEALLHPLALREMRRMAEDSAHTALLLAEVPLLFEAQWQEEFHCVVSVYCERLESVRRLGRRDHIPAAAALAALEAQLPARCKALAADHVVDNSGPWTATLQEIMVVGQILREKYVDKPRAEP